MLVYIAQPDDKGQLKTFYKVYQDGFHDGKWATDRLIAAKG